MVQAQLWVLCHAMPCHVGTCVSVFPQRCFTIIISTNRSHPQARSSLPASFVVCPFLSHSPYFLSSALLLRLDIASVEYTHFTLSLSLSRRAPLLSAARLCPRFLARLLHLPVSAVHRDSIWLLVCKRCRLTTPGQGLPSRLSEQGDHDDSRCIPATRLASRRLNRA